MPRIRMYTVFALVVVLAVGAMQAVSGAYRALPTPTVATINITRVINGLDEIEARQQQLQSFIGDRTSKITDLEKQFEIAKGEYDLLPSDGAARQGKAEELERLRMQIRFESELADVLINARRGEIFAALFEKIDATVSELSSERGYTLVLSDDQDSSAPGNPTEQQARAAIYGRRVMFADSSVDITDELVIRMNNQWKTGQGP